MARKSQVTASAEQYVALKAMARDTDRAQADRARAILLTLSGWTSTRIAEAFGVRDDTVRLWRSTFMADGVAALERGGAPGRAPVKGEAALRVVTSLLEASVNDQPNWTLARLAEEIKAREGVLISRSQLSKLLHKKGVLLPLATAQHKAPEK